MNKFYFASPFWKPLLEAPSGSPFWKPLLEAFASLLLPLVLLSSCQSQPELPPEPWASKPLSEWPSISMINEITFADTTYPWIGNGFLVDTREDTLAVTCKHTFLYFKSFRDHTHISLGKDFRSWVMYPKNHTERKAHMSRLINEDVNEPIGEYNTMKDRDWLIFKMSSYHDSLYPLKIRPESVRSGETVYAVGWGVSQENFQYPSFTKLKVFKLVGDYFYTETVDSNVENPAGTSGSPVIDSKGYLVGIVSGAEGKLGVIGAVSYLERILGD